MQAVTFLLHIMYNFLYQYQLTCVFLTSDKLSMYFCKELPVIQNSNFWYQGQRYSQEKISQSRHLFKVCFKKTVTQHIYWKHKHQKMAIFVPTFFLQLFQKWTAVGIWHNLLTGQMPFLSPINIHELFKHCTR